MTHLGIELSPGACRIIEIDGESAWASRGGAARVRSFAIVPPSGAETDAKLASLAGKPAAVIVWNAPSDHRQVVVTGGSYEAMRAEALASLASAGLQTRGVLADVSPAGARPKRGKRQPVVVTLAAAPDVTTALQPLENAGIDVRTVTTPAAALGSLARLRRSLAVPGTIEAYVAFEEKVTCVALVRDAILVAARELPWGYVETRNGAPQVRARDEIAARLGDGIAEFAAAIGGEPRDIGQICIAGGMPEMRSMTATLMERLDVEVEPLDSLFAIDVAHLPEPADEFRERGAELRLAWAAAADWPPAINLLRARRRQASRTMLSRAAVAAGVIVGLAGGWRVTQTAWWQSTAKTVAARPAATNANGGAGPRARGPAAPQSPVLSAKKAPVAAPPLLAASKTPGAQTPQPATPTKPAPAAPPAPVAVAKSAPVATPSAAAASNKPAAAGVAAAASNKPAAAGVATTASNKPAAAAAPAATASNRPAAATPPAITMNTPAAASVPATTSNKPVTSSAQGSAGTASSASGLPVAAARPSVPTGAPPLLPAPRADAPRAAAAQPPARAAAPPTARVEPPVTGSERPPVTRSEPSGRSSSTPAPAAPRAAPAVRQEPPVNAAANRSPPPPLRSEPPAVSAVVPSRATQAPRVDAGAAPQARQRPAPVDAPLGFDAALGTILYSPDRKLAIVDGRIVGVGDEIRGARIVDITPTAVMLRDAQGRLRRLALGASGR